MADEGKYFQFCMDGRPAAPRRPTIVEAVDDAVTAGMARWVDRKTLVYETKAHLGADIKRGSRLVGAGHVKMRDRLIASLPGRAAAPERRPGLRAVETPPDPVTPLRRPENGDSGGFRSTSAIYVAPEGREEAESTLRRLRDRLFVLAMERNPGVPREALGIEFQALSKKERRFHVIAVLNPQQELPL